MLEKIELPETADTPSVLFDHQSCVLELKGESYPENAQEFYQPILESLNRFVKADRGPLVVSVNLPYFNSSSSKCLLDIFDILEEYAVHRKGIQVNWYYQEGDEDLRESGEDFAEDLALTFNLISFT